MTLKQALTFHKKRIFLICLGLVLIAGGVFLLCRAMDPYDNRILSGVSIGGLDVGGMTKGEARRALTAALEETLNEAALEISLPEETLSLSPADTQVRVNVRKAVNAAYRYGRTKEETPSEIGLLPYLKLDEAAIRGVLEGYAAVHDTVVSESGYALEGKMPALSTDAYSAAPCQSLVLTLGEATVHLDVDAAYGEILAVYNSAIEAVQNGEYRVEISEIPPDEAPALPDLEAIYEELYIAPADDSLNMETYELVHGSYGYGFSLEEAEQLLAQAEYGDTLTIPMTYITPEILGDQVYFRDVLGECETPHNDNENRNTNLRLVCEILDGLILQPGEEFSFNGIVGQRTAERGFKPAPAYSGSGLVNSVGGGVCQTSTTLYNCALLADLDIVFRVCHGMTVSYVPLGLDAAVNWLTTDFQFANSTNFPIMIKAEYNDETIKMQLLGTDEKDYYIVMEAKHSYSYSDNVIYAASYKCKYDKETGELISRELEARSTYIY